jgi:predicted nucleic acid-binding protein
VSLLRRVYWDSCTFIGLLNQEPNKIVACTEVWKEAEKGVTAIYTSFLSFAEVFRVKCEGKGKPLTDQLDAQIANMLRQRWIKPVVVDERIGIAARRLLRHYPECKKPTDGIHLASALSLNVDEMHTYDGSDLLMLDGRIQREDGKMLTICIPRTIPLPPAPDEPPSLFEEP